MALWLFGSLGFDDFLGKNQDMAFSIGTKRETLDFKTHAKRTGLLFGVKWDCPLAPQGYDKRTHLPNFGRVQLLLEAPEDGLFGGFRVFSSR